MGTSGDADYSRLRLLHWLHLHLHYCQLRGSPVELLAFLVYGSMDMPMDILHNPF